MTLEEISQQYKEAAEPLRKRIKELRAQLKTATDPDEIWHLRRRIAELSPMLTQMNKLAETTEHYYDRNYYVSSDYSVINANMGSIIQVAIDERQREQLDEIGDVPMMATQDPDFRYKMYGSTKIKQEAGSLAKRRNHHES